MNGNGPQLPLLYLNSNLSDKLQCSILIKQLFNLNQQFLFMSQQDLFRTVQIQQNQIAQLRNQLSNSSTYQVKYKKALKEISQIVKANRELKEELKKFSNFRSGQNESMNRINQEQLGKAYQKLLKEKNQILGEKQSLQLQNQKLKYSIASLQETVNKLKSEKMALAREKQGMAKLSEGTNDKFRQGGSFKEKESDMRKTLQNYQQRHSSLTKTNRKLEDQLAQLENKIYSMQAEYKNKLNEKDVQLQVSKTSAREQYQSQVNSLKKQVSQLKITNNELSNKLTVYSEKQKYPSEGQNQYDEQLIETLRDLKMQMQPMSAQIAELQEKNQSEKEQTQREKASLQIKVMEYEAEIQRIKQSHKLLQQKLLKQTERSRKWDQSERNIKRLQEENRMLGGRVIVLEAKEVALRNRSGDQLQQRVLEFQTRVQMLLSDKQTISNMKNIGIHQLIALKAYIMELDAKLKQVVNENEYAVKKYKSYKQKCTQLIRQLKQHDIAINALKGKLQGYDRLVVKLQGQLERAITINDNEMKAINVKISQSTINSIQVYKKRYESLLEKLNLQQKYAEQQIQTLKLNYDTKLLDLNLKLEELSSIKQTIGLYKSKNEQLSNRLTQKQNELLQSKMTKIHITDTIPHSKNPHKDTINKLNETINIKETTIVGLENQIRRIQLQWKAKYNQLEQTMNSSLSKKNRDDDDRRKQVENLQNQIRVYRSRINELQMKSSQPVSRVDDQHDFRKPHHHYTGQISDLQIQLEQIKNRYEIQNAKVVKLSKANADLKQTNNDLEGEVSRIRFELKRLEKQMQLQLQDKNAELRRAQSRVQENLDTSRIQKKESDVNPFKLATMKMEYELLQGQVEQLEKDKNKYYNRALQLQKQVSELHMKIQQFNFTLQRTRNTASNDVMMRQAQREQQNEKLQYNLKSLRDKNADLQDRINEYETEMNKLRAELNKQRQRLATELDQKDEQISKISRELNKIRYEVTNQDDVRDGIQQQFEYKMNRMNNQITNLRDELARAQNQLQRYEGELRFLKNRQMEYNSKASEQDNYLMKISNDLKNFQNREVQMQSQLMEKQTIISKLKSQLNYIRDQISQIQTTIESKDTQISRLTSQLNNVKNAQIEWQIEISGKASQFNKLNSDLNYARNKNQDLQQQIYNLQGQISRLRSQNMSNQQNFSTQASQIQEKQMIIMRLQSDNKQKGDQIYQLSSQLDGKNAKINELQNESIRYRSMSSDIESQLMQKTSQISRLNYQINNYKIRYENLESEHQTADNNWNMLNRELNSIKSQIGNYEDDLQMKNNAIERYKGDIRELQQQMQNLNEEIFQKNKVINNLNQQLFRLKLQGEGKSSDQIYKLENQIYQLKSRVSTLQRQLEVKEEELGRARLEISTVRSNITLNRYTDDQYDLLQAQFYQVQKSLTETRSVISEKDLQITQLQAKIQYMAKMQADDKRRFNEQRNDLETELQNVLNRQRQLRNQINNLENEAILTQNKNSDDKQWGLHLYQQQCDRLQKIVTELQEQVNALKLKLTYMTNQQDRIVENLTIMTLTFAQVEALRQRMKIKQNQISQVRKSLINFATSSDQITSMNSRVAVKQRRTSERKQERPSIEQIDSANTNVYKRSQNTYTTEVYSNNFSSQQGQFIKQSQTYAVYQAQPTNQPKSQFYNNTGDQRLAYAPEYSYYQPPASNTGYGSSQTTAQNNSKVQNEYGYNKEQERKEWEQQNLHQVNQTADKRLNQMISSMTGNQASDSSKNYTNKSESSKQQVKSSGQGQQQINYGVQQTRIQTTQGQNVVNFSQSQRGQQDLYSGFTQNQNPSGNIQAGIQNNQSSLQSGSAVTNQTSQQQISQQTAQQTYQGVNQSINQQFSPQSSLTNLQPGVPLAQQPAQSNLNNQYVGTQNSGRFSSVQSYSGPTPTQTQPQQVQSQNQTQQPQPQPQPLSGQQPSWRYGASNAQSISVNTSIQNQQFGNQALGSNTQIKNQTIPQVGQTAQFGQTSQGQGSQNLAQTQPTMNVNAGMGQMQQVQVQRSSQQQIRINVGTSNTSNPIGSNKAISPLPYGGNANISLGGTMPISGQPQTTNSFQNRQFGYPQPVQYPGFAR